MKKLIYTVIPLLLSLCCKAQDSILNRDKQPEQMNNIKFVPKEFHEIELGYYEAGQNSCSPVLSNEINSANFILINTPQKITYNMNKVKLPIVPVCIYYMISLRRGAKYFNLSAKMINVRKIGEETVYSGEIIHKDENHIILPQNHDQMEKKRQKRLEEAQKYSDDELDEGQSSGCRMNINLMEYVDIPLISGKYEIYLSFSELESNRMIVEILCK